MEREKLKGGIIITPRDIQLITGTDCIRSAQREHKLTRDAIGKKSKKLSVKEYCAYWELDYLEIIDFLQWNR
ncbi:MAG: hypothetical protein MK105_02410 [Crocinitomicaceae bacterium]|nr:hypothetical protein [Crocinitomicaceae bacterium]